MTWLTAMLDHQKPRYSLSAIRIIILLSSLEVNFNNLQILMLRNDVNCIYILCFFCFFSDKFSMTMVSLVKLHLTHISGKNAQLVPGINKNTLETCTNPRPTSGWSELTKLCTTSTMNFHMAYFSWISQNNARLKISCKFGESKCDPC